MARKKLWFEKHRHMPPGRDNSGERARADRARRARDKRAKQTHDEAAQEMATKPLDFREVRNMASNAEHLQPDSRRVLRDACLRRAAAAAAQWLEVAARLHVEPDVASDVLMIPCDRARRSE
jgi:hypothetical protein